MTRAKANPLSPGNNVGRPLPTLLDLITDNFATRLRAMSRLVVRSHPYCGTQRIPRFPNRIVSESANHADQGQGRPSPRILISG
jgi:hypothetical protein